MGSNPTSTASLLVEFEHPYVQDRTLLKRSPQRPVQPVLQVQLPVPADHVREQVPVESGIGGQHAMQVQHVLGRDELVQSDWAGRYLGPLTRGPGMFGVWPSIPDLLEDHLLSLKEYRAHCRASVSMPCAVTGRRT